MEDASVNELEGESVTGEESVEDVGLNEPEEEVVKGEGEVVKGERAAKAGDKPFSRLALVLGVGIAGMFIAWTIMRTLSEGFGWPYYGWPY